MVIELPIFSRGPFSSASSFSVAALSLWKYPDHLAEVGLKASRDNFLTASDNSSLRHC